MKIRRTSLSISMPEEFADEVKAYVAKHQMKISDFVVSAIKDAMRKDASHNN